MNAYISKLSLQTKMFLGPGIVILALIIVGMSAILNLQKAEELQQLIAFRQERTAIVAGADDLFVESRGNLYQTLTWGRARYEQTRIDALVRQTKEKMEKGIAILQELVSSATSQQRAGEYRRLLMLAQEFQKTALAVIDLASFDLNSATMSMATVDEKYDALNKAIEELQQYRTQEMKELVAESKSSINASVTTMIVVMIIALFLSVLVVVQVNKNVVGAVRAVADVVHNVAEGDFTQAIPKTSNDEIGKLADDINEMVESLKQALQQVAESGATIASATTQISSSTEEMSAGAQEQTSQAGEVASAVEEMTKTIIENSRNATQTAETAKKAKNTAEEGGVIVQNTIEGMRRIADVVRRSAETVQNLGRSSDQIGEIISVIDDIADQTNLLALNAAIEAARAGEQGRGFAVVADEVRKLAERTTKATKEIATMIRQIQTETKGAVESMAEGTQKVDEGIALADKAGNALEKIVDISQQVTDMVNQIAAASEQQSSASEQISKNIEAISTVTQQTASGIQQIAHSAEDLNRLTEQLRELLAKFKLGTQQEKDSRIPRQKLAAQRQFTAGARVAQRV